MSGRRRRSLGGLLLLVSTLATPMMIEGRLTDDPADEAAAADRSGFRAGVLPSMDPPLVSAWPARQGADGPKLYSANCKPCHGARGRGDGPTAQWLTPPPSDISDPEYLATVIDDELAKVIKSGVGVMGPSELSDDEIASIVQFVRRLGALRGGSEQPAR